MLVNLDNQEAVAGEEDFAKLFEASEKKQSSGAVQLGEIVELGSEFAMVAIPNEKLEAMLRVSEITDESGNVLFQKGDKIEVFVTRAGGDRLNASFTRVVKNKKIAAFINKLGENYKDVKIEGKIIRKNKGGYVLECDGIDVFLPRRESAIKDDNNAIGRIYKVAITSVDKDNNTIIVSRKRYFDIEDKVRKQLVENISQSGDVQTGVVKKITSFGMFVDVGGVEGLVHYTDISIKGPTNAANSFKEGDEVQVKVLKYDEAKRRLSLSIKALSNDPWKEIEKELEVGYAVKAVVSNIEKYGAFVDLGNDIEGFLHISEISWDKHIKHPSDYISVGQELDVEIIEIKPESKKLRVSLKKLLDKPFAKFAKNHQVGDVIKGKIATITDFGAFIKIDGVDGLLHNEDAFWEKNIKCKDKFKEGDEIEVKIIKIDREHERISLSKRVLEDSPVGEFAKSHKVDDKLKGKIVDIRDFGIFIRLNAVIDAFMRNDDIAPLKKEDLKIGDEIECIISNIDEQNNKIRVSIKRLERQKEKEHLKALNNTDEKMTLGDKLKNRL